MGPRREQVPLFIVFKSCGFLEKLDRIFLKIREDRGMKFKDFKLNTSLVIPYFGGHEKKTKPTGVKSEFYNLSLYKLVVQKVLKICSERVIK